VPLAFHSGREADHSPPCSAEAKEWVELYLYSPNTPSWRGARGSTGTPFTFFIIDGYSLFAGGCVCFIDVYLRSGQVSSLVSRPLFVFMANVFDS